MISIAFFFFVNFLLPGVLTTIRAVLLRSKVNKKKLPKCESNAYFSCTDAAICVFKCMHAKQANQVTRLLVASERTELDQTKSIISCGIEIMSQ